MSIRFPCLALAVLLVAAPACLCAAGEDEALRPEVGRPLQDAEALIRQQKFQEALAKIGKAEAAGPLSARETSLVEQLRGSAATGAGDYLKAALAYEAAIATGRLGAAEKLRLTRAVAVLSYQAKDYPKAIVWVKRYQDAGGTDEQTRALLPQAYYASEDWAGAVNALRDQIAAAERAGHPAGDQPLKLLASAQLKLNDTAGYQATLEKLVAAYPRPEYWTDLIQRLQSRPGFPRRLALDVFRLSRAVGVLSSPGQYVEAAELALQAGLPGEAKSLLDQGFSSGVLGTGGDAERHRRLLALATQKAADDLKSLGDIAREAAAARDGTPLVTIGLDYLGHGQPQQAVQLIQQGVAKGVAKNPDDARLHLGVALDAAGQKDQSVQAFRALQGSDVADLARLWALHTAARTS